MVMQIAFEQVGFTYGAGTPFASEALHDINVTIPDGSYTAIIGHTGSGKSTITQHLNALVQPTVGQVRIGEAVVSADSKPKDLKKIRQRVGMVFQFPEGQLFEETVLKDVMFGPMNFGDDEATAREKAEAALAAVGIASTLFERSPFELSGGQMRRVAIAGVIAMKPEVLVLDEPTAGLDPKGRMEMMSMFDRLYRDQGLTIVLVTHQMEDVAAYANHVIVLDGGTCVKEGTPAEVFADPAWLASHQLALPDAADFAFNLQDKLDRQLWDTATEVPLTVDALADLIVDKLALATGQNDDDKLSGFITGEGGQL